MFHCLKRIGLAYFFACRNPYTPLASYSHSKIRSISSRLILEALNQEKKHMNQNIRVSIQPIFVSLKIEHDLQLREVKPPVVKACLLIEMWPVRASWVSFTRRHLNKRWTTQEGVFIYWQIFRWETLLGPPMIFSQNAKTSLVAWCLTLNAYESF